MEDVLVAPGLAGEIFIERRQREVRWEDIDSFRTSGSKVCVVCKSRTEKDQCKSVATTVITVTRGTPKLIVVLTV